jgi:hypothetical protein
MHTPGDQIDNVVELLLTAQRSKVMIRPVAASDRDALWTAAKDETLAFSFRWAADPPNADQFFQQLTHGTVFQFIYQQPGLMGTPLGIVSAYNYIPGTIVYLAAFPTTNAGHGSAAIVALSSAIAHAFAYLQIDQVFVEVPEYLMTMAGTVLERTFDLVATFPDFILHNGRTWSVFHWRLTRKAWAQLIHDVREHDDQGSLTTLEQFAHVLRDRFVLNDSLSILELQVFLEEQCGLDNIDCLVSDAESWTAVELALFTRYVEHQADRRTHPIFDPTHDDSKGVV